MQLPAVCGFMLSSTRAGSDNYIYSIWLGALIAIIGLASSVRSLLRGARNPLLIAGTVASAAFIAVAFFGHGWYGSSCRAIYFALLAA